MAPPVYDLRADPGVDPSMRRRVTVDYLDDTRFLPRQILFHSDGTNCQFGPNNVRISDLYPPPYDQGFVAAGFETTAVTNWHGRLLLNRESQQERGAEAHARDVIDRFNAGRRQRILEPGLKDPKFLAAVL